MTTARDNSVRDNAGHFTRTLQGAERDMAACRMKERGATFQQISDTLGYGGRGNVHRAIKQALASIPAESAEELRLLQLGQLDYLTAQAIAVLERQHLTITQAGKVVEYKDEVVLDDGPVLQSIGLLLRIHDRRAKLMGLDAPTRQGMITLDAIDAEIAALSAEFDRDQADTAEGSAEA